MEQQQPVLEVVVNELDKLEQFNSPLKLLKKAFSSLLVVGLIGAGFVVNAIMALFFAFSGFGNVIWWQYLGGIILLLAIFPAVYIFFAISYARSVVVWEAYKEIIRPLVAKVFGKSLDFYLVDNPESAPPVNENGLIAEVENRQKHLLEKLPDFLRAYVQIFFTGKDVLNIVRAQRATGGDKEAIKRKSMDSLFESIDLQISELTEPSLIPFGIVAVVNVVVVYFLF